MRVAHSPGMDPISCIPMRFEHVFCAKYCMCCLISFFCQCQGGDQEEKSLSLYIAPDGYGTSHFFHKLI